MPFLRLLVPFAAGIYAGLSCFHPDFLATAGLSSCAALVFGAMLFLYNTRRFARKWIGLAVFTLFFLSGFWLATGRRSSFRDAYFAGAKAEFFLVRINSEPQEKESTIRFTAEVYHALRDTSGLRVCGTAMIAVQKSESPGRFAYGDELLLPARFTPVRAPLNPAEFNYREYLWQQDIAHQFFFRTDEVSTLRTDRGDPLIAAALRLRKQMVSRLGRYMHNREAIAVASTLLLGYRAELSEETLQAYSRTGTLHVLSVSGMHVALLYIVILRLFSPVIFAYRWRWIKPLLSILLIWMYAGLTGFSPSVNRSALMITLVIAGRAFERKNHTLNVWAFSAFVLLVYRPFYLMDVGFQLSYLAAFGLIVLQPAIENVWKPTNRLLKTVWPACAVSLAAQWVTTPLSIYYFHQFPLYFLLSNLFIIIPSAVIMYSGIALLVLPEIPYLSTWIGWILEKTILATNAGLHLIERAPLASIDRFWIDRLEYFLLSAGLLLLAILLVGRRRGLLFPAMIALLLFCLSISLKSIDKLRRRQLYVLSLRRNDAFVLQSGGTARVITTLNAHDKAFRYSIQPLLDSLGLRGTELFSPGKIMRAGNYRREGPFIQAGSTLIYLCDRESLRTRAEVPLRADIVYITGNPFTDLRAICSSVTFHHLVIGPENGKRLRKKLQEEALLAGIPCTVLGEEPAYLLRSP
ncbi:MAG: ComEC family competence protein [Mucilaginibacter polytrichastri]|nr:ComEC family competence protein [Mucilaginibacter polytrichastri]